VSAAEMVWRELHLPSPLQTDLVLALLRRLASHPLPGPTVLEARGSAGRVRHFLGAPGPRIRDLELLVETLLPGSSLEAAGASVINTGPLRLGLSRPGLPLQSDHVGDVTRGVLAALARTVDDEELILQVALKEGRAAHLSSTRATDPTQSLGSRLLTGERPANAQLTRTLRTRAADAGFKLIARIGATAGSRARQEALLRGLIGALRTAQPVGGRMTFTSDRFALQTIPRWGLLDLSVHELLNVLGWPLGAVDAPGMSGPHPKLLRLRARDIERHRVFGVTAAPGPEQPVGISTEDALLHTHLIGPTGTGKSSTLLHLAARDFESGRSVVIIDPKSDLVRDALSVVPDGRQDEVVILDPTQDLPTGLNPLYQPGRSPELVADSILGVFREMYPGLFGPRTSDVLHSALLTLASIPDATLTWLPRLLTEATFRAELISRIADPMLASFWSQFDRLSAAQQAQFVGPVLARLRQFLLRPTLRRVLDQPHPTFTLGDVFSKPRLLFVPLNTGLLGGEAARLLGSLLVSSLWGLSLARAGLPIGQRRPVSIFVDEAHEFLRHGGDDLADALSRSRSLGVAWHLAHQYREQLPPETRAAVDANARNKIIFSLGVKDAREMAAMASELEPEDFVALPRFHVYARLMRRGEQLPWLSARTLPPPPAISDPDDLIRRSSHLYGGKRGPLAPEGSAETAAESPNIGRKRRQP
jgi:hypothetical protein